MLFGIVLDTPLRDTLFQKNRRRAGFALRSAHLIPWRPIPASLRGHRAAMLLGQARSSASIAVASGAAILALELGSFLVPVLHGT